MRQKPGDNDDIPPPSETRARASLSRHRSVWEMRADGWISLVDDLSRLAILAPEHPERASRLAHVQTIIDALAPVESYWAFPGAGSLASCASG